MRKFFQALTLLGIFTLFFAAATFPFVFNLAEHYIQLSDQSFYGYVYMQVYRLGKSIQFYPWPFSTYFSDLMLLGGLIYSGFYTLTKNLILSVNLTTIIYFLLNYLSAFLCSWRLLKNKVASVFVALIFTFNPITMNHFPHHLQLIMQFLLPPIFLFSYLFFQKPNRKDLFWLLVFFSLNVFTNIYFAIYGLLIVGCFGLVYTVKERSRLWQYIRQLLSLAILALPFILVLLLYFLPYLNFYKYENMNRSLRENIAYSATFLDFVTPDKHSLFYNRLYNYLLRYRTPNELVVGLGESALFPGIIPILAAIVGLIYLRSRKRELYEVSLLLIVLAFVLSLGPYFIWVDNLNSGLKLPYSFLFENLSFMRALRVPTRLMFLAGFPLALAAGEGLRRLAKKKIVLSALLIVLLLESCRNYKIDWQHPLYNQAQSLLRSGRINFLKGQPTVHLPMAETIDSLNYLGWLALTGENSFNGYSGYFPPDWQTLRLSWVRNFSLKSLAEMSTLGYRYLVVHKDLLSNSDWQSLTPVLYTDKLTLRLQTKNIAIYEFISERNTSACSASAKPAVSFVGFRKNMAVWVVANKQACILVNAKQRFYKDRYGQFSLPMLLQSQEKVTIKIPMNKTNIVGQAISKLGL